MPTDIDALLERASEIYDDKVVPFGGPFDISDRMLGECIAAIRELREDRERVATERAFLWDSMDHDDAVRIVQQG